MSITAKCLIAIDGKRVRCVHGQRRREGMCGGQERGVRRAGVCGACLVVAQSVVRRAGIRAACIGHRRGRLRRHHGAAFLCGKTDVRGEKRAVRPALLRHCVAVRVKALVARHGVVVAVVAAVREQ